MSFKIKDKFSSEVPEAAEVEEEAPEAPEAPEGPLEAPAGDYSADVTPPAPEAHYAAGEGTPDSGEEAPA